MDSIGHLGLTKNRFVLSASVQALSDYEYMKRQLLTVPEEDNGLADGEEGHLSPHVSATLQKGLNEDIHETESHTAAVAAGATAPVALMTLALGKESLRSPKEGEFSSIMCEPISPLTCYEIGAFLVTQTHFRISSSKREGFEYKILVISIICSLLSLLRHAVRITGYPFTPPNQSWFSCQRSTERPDTLSTAYILSKRSG